MAAAKSLVLLSPPAPRAARAARAARRRRARPSDRWELHAADGCDTAACAAFLDALEAWPRDAWLALGRRAASARQAPDALDAVVAARALAVTAWLVRDVVATAAAIACGSERDAAPAVGAARAAAERAALACLLRPWLARDDYLALTAPFHPR
jgi:hypothetical protein